MTNKPKIRRPYDASPRSTISFPEKTMTKQSFKDECDINNIMAKYENTGLIEHVANVQAQYGDFTTVQDYQLSLNQVIAAQEAFEALPAKIRERFANDPAHLMAFLQDKDNQEEAMKLGLIERPEEPAKPMKVEVVNQPAGRPYSPPQPNQERPGEGATYDRPPQGGSAQ